MNKLHEFLVIISFFICSPNLFAEGIARLEFKKDLKIEGEFSSQLNKIGDELRKILANINYLETGKTIDRFPLIGIRATFLVKQNDDYLILTMIDSLPKQDNGGLFHLSKSTQVAGLIYSVAEPPNYEYLRIFKDENLWIKLNKALDDER